MESQKCPKPRDFSRGKPKSYPWKFKIQIDYPYQSTITGREFDSQWLRLGKDGLITVKANSDGYAWDGCTPKFSFLGLVIIGVPDGHIDVDTMQPKTYHASLVHDAFYQYLEDVPVSKREIDDLFLKMLIERSFPLARLYYLAVHLFGGIGVKQKNIQSIPPSC
ncbi:MAG: hypothetical protein AAFY67_12065 [Cyanobacteria bacterium J06642_9]